MWSAYVTSPTHPDTASATAAAAAPKAKRGGKGGKGLTAGLPNPTPAGITLAPDSDDTLIEVQAERLVDLFARATSMQANNGSKAPWVAGARYRLHMLLEIPGSDLAGEDYTVLPCVHGYQYAGKLVPSLVTIGI